MFCKLIMLECVFDSTTRVDDTARKSTLTHGIDGTPQLQPSSPQDGSSTLQKYLEGRKLDQPDTAQLAIKSQNLISPSSIPNPSPSTSTKPSDGVYPSYGGYLYSIPGYSAFQPIQYPVPVENAPEPPSPSKDVIQLNPVTIDNTKTVEDTKEEVEEVKEEKTLKKRFSLKTSIPISKIDNMKCVELSAESAQKVKIQSNILIRTASKPNESNANNEASIAMNSESEAIPLVASQGKIIIGGGNFPRVTKTVLPTKHGPDLKPPPKTKASDPKNPMAPSRLQGAQKKTREATGKVVALKRLHQDNGDENDFENLITENQIYGNKIVVKEKPQGLVLQEQHAYQQPNYLYLSNVRHLPYKNIATFREKPKLIFNGRQPYGEVFSSIDLAEKRRRMKRLKYLARNEPHIRSKASDSSSSCDSVVTACDIKLEIQKEFLKSKMRDEEFSSESSSDSESDYSCDVSHLTERDGLHAKEEKIRFLKTFGLITPKEKSDIQVSLLEKSIKLDAVAKACIAVGHMEYVLKGDSSPNEPVNGSQPVKYSLPVPKLRSDFDPKDALTDNKMSFMLDLQLNRVPRTCRDDYEVTFEKIIIDRKKRNGESTFTKYCEDWYRIFSSERNESLDRHARGQLKRMTEIKRSVNETNNLIRMRLDSFQPYQPMKNNDISALAERNFSEITQLSRMADNCLKILGRSDERKAPNGGRFATISVPNVAKIIALKSMLDFSIADTSPAVSMDEPQSSAKFEAKFDQLSSDSSTDTIEIFPSETKNGYSKDYFTAATELPGFGSWPGINAVEECYRRYDAACQSERLFLYSENMRLKKEIQIKRSEVSSLNDSIRQILGDKHASEFQANSIKKLYDKLHNCLDIIRGVVM